MPSNSSVLALFSPKPPVEPTESKLDRRSEVDFNDFLNNATDQAERSAKPSSGNSTKNNKLIFVLLVLTAFAVVRTHGLFATVMLSGVFSLLSALLFIIMDAVDVAFTEAAVGAGISTVLMLSTLTLTSRHEKKPTRSNILPLR